jgi:hypothetical protein
MSPIVRYTIARLALFVVVALVLLVIPVQVNVLIKLAAALLITAALAYFLLRGLRDQVAEQLAGAARRRAERKERLRSALSGEDESTDR